MKKRIVRMREIKKTNPSETTDHQRYLQQATQLILVLYARFGVDEPSLVRDRAITAHKDVISNRLPENFNLENICDNFFCFAVNVWVDEGDVVVAGDYVSEG